MRKKIVWTVTAIVLGGLILAGALAWGFYNSKLDKIQYDDGSREMDVSTVIEPDEQAPDYTLEDLPSKPEASEENSEENSLPEEIHFDKDVFNVLLLGTDERTEQFNDNARADSIMVASFNMKENTVRLVSIERGIGVPVPGRPDDWITHTFRYGGAQLTLQTVRECFGLDIDRYVRINFHFFARLIDAIGGVDVTLTQAEADGLNGKVYTNAETKQEVFPGVNHLDGYDALQYSRLRFIDSDWRRIERQRKTIQAAVNQIKSLNLAELNNLADTCLPMIQTNLEKSEITGLLMKAPGFLMGDHHIDNMTIPVDGTFWGEQSEDGRSLIRIDYQKNSAVLKEFFYGEDAE